MKYIVYCRDPAEGAVGTARGASGNGTEGTGGTCRLLSCRVSPRTFTSPHTETITNNATIPQRIKFLLSVDDGVSLLGKKKYLTIPNKNKIYQSFHKIKI